MNIYALVAWIHCWILCLYLTALCFYKTWCKSKKIILKHIAVILNAYHSHNFRVTCIITCKTFIPLYFKPEGAERKYSTLWTKNIDSLKISNVPCQKVTMLMLLLISPAACLTQSSVKINLHAVCTEKQVWTLVQHRLLSQKNAAHLHLTYLSQLTRHSSQMCCNTAVLFDKW